MPSRGNSSEAARLAGYCTTRLLFPPCPKSQHLSNDRADPTATGLLVKTKNITFVMNLQLFNCVLLHLSVLVKLFQTGDLNFAQVQPAVDLYVNHDVNHVGG